MKLLSSTDVAIAQAVKSETLRMVERVGRFGPYVSIEDRHGIIEVADDMAEANERINAIKAALN